MLVKLRVLPWMGANNVLAVGIVRLNRSEEAFMVCIHNTQYRRAHTYIGTKHIYNTLYTLHCVPMSLPEMISNLLNRYKIILLPLAKC